VEFWILLQKKGMAKKNTKEPLKLNRLKVILVEKGISQTDFANALKVDRNTISRICNNKSQPALKFLFEIAYALDVEVKELLNTVASVEGIFGKEKKVKYSKK
jgi:putative transcriptional regulator